MLRLVRGGVPLGRGTILSDADRVPWPEDLAFPVDDRHGHRSRVRHGGEARRNAA